MVNTLSKLLGNSPKSISNWKKENRPIISLLYKYFKKEDLEEFLQNGQIKKFEKFEKFEELERRLSNQYISYFLKGEEGEGIVSWDDQSSIPLYFAFLHFLKYYHSQFINFNDAFISFALSYKQLADTYEFIYAPRRNLTPLLNFFDNKLGMYQYIVSIVQNDLKELGNYETGKKEIEEAKQHIMLYNEHKINFIENVAGAEIVIQKLKNKDDTQAAKISSE